MELRELLERSRVAYERVGAAGATDEIAVIAARPSEFDALTGLARSIRALGFRFVALDLDAPTDSSGRAGVTEGPVVQPNSEAP